MGYGNGRAWVVAVVLCTLLFPAVGSAADTQEKLNKVQKERDRVQEKIDVHEAKADDLKANVQDLNAQLIDLRRELAKLETRIEIVSSKVRSVQADIDDTQAEIDKIKDTATEQAVSLYKSGATDELNALLDSDNFAELDTRIEMLGVAAQRNTDELIRYGRLRLHIEKKHEELFRTQTTLESIRKDKAAVHADLDEKHDELAANLAALEKKLGKEHAHEEILAKQEAKLKADILAAQVGRAIAARGVSASGFVWPLNGAITSYYGPRWGRMHTGIDIDGTSGQPIVASKSGRVIVASYYGGYGNAVVIDHGGGVSTLYGHMSRYGVSNGQTVSQGQVVGYVGCTGSCTGDHLHFEVRINGNPVNPLDYLP